MGFKPAVVIERFWKAMSMPLGIIELKRLRTDTIKHSTV